MSGFGFGSYPENVFALASPSARGLLDYSTEPIPGHTHPTMLPCLDCLLGFLTYLLYSSIFSSRPTELFSVGGLCPYLAAVFE